MKFLIPCFIFLGLYSANAQQLVNYTDRELLREMRYRGYECSDSNFGLEAIRVIATCDAYTNLIIELYDNEANKKGEAKYYLGSNSKCDGEKNRLLNKIEGNQLYRSKVLAFCDPYTNLIKIRFDIKGSISEIEKRYEGSNTRCNDNATLFNDTFGGSL